MAIVGLTILIPADMNDNNSSSSNLTDKRHGDMHMSGINMDMSKNLNAKKPTPSITKMPNMKSM
ncbi:MAG: hypothetical protein ACJ71K_14735 [Nitrososphaeraceae archaeon]